jgi:hypothetical protein
MLNSGVTTALVLETINTDTRQYLRPDADLADGLWLNESGSNVNLYASVDEAAPPSDTDYIQSSRNPSVDVCQLRFSDPTGAVGQPFIVHYRIRRVFAGNINLTVRLKQGATQKASWTHSNVAFSNFLTLAHQISSAEFASITDFNDLSVELQADLA